MKASGEITIINKHSNHIAKSMDLESAFYK